MKFSISQDYDGWNIHTMAESAHIDQATRKPARLRVHGRAEFKRPGEFLNGYTDISRIDIPARGLPALEFPDFKTAQNEVFALLKEAVDQRKRN